MTVRALAGGAKGFTKSVRAVRRVAPIVEPPVEGLQVAPTTTEGSFKIQTKQPTK